MSKISQFFKETVAELRKVVWPTRDDVVSSVVVVLISSVIVAIILGFIDFVFTAGMNKIF
ncbi:MAG: preprotein translocase subunit SecE [Treponemataceae bacterium]